MIKHVHPIGPRAFVATFTVIFTILFAFASALGISGMSHHSVAGLIAAPTGVFLLGSIILACTLYLD